MTDRPFMTDHQMISEIRDDVKSLSSEFKNFKDEVVLKEELNMWKSAQTTTRRWAIGIIISLIGVGISVTWIILAIND